MKELGSFFKPTGLKAIALTLVLALAALPVIGCGGKFAKLPPPPAGCEDSVLWGSGFMPMGPALVKIGFMALASYVPESCDPLLVAAYKAQDALKADRLTEGIDRLIGGLLDENVKDPLVGEIARESMQVLYQVLALPEHLFTPCDKEIVKGMVDDIIRILEAGKAKANAQRRALAMRTPDPFAPIF